MKYLKKTIIIFGASFLLVSCGSSTSSSAPEVIINETPIVDLIPQVADEVPAEDIVEPDQLSVIFASDDMESGGYVGSTGPLRSTVTFPEDVEGFKFGILTRFGSSGLKVDATFGSFDTAQRLYEYMSDFNRPLDSCQHVSRTILNGYGERLSPPFFGFTFLNAGEVLPLFSAESSVGELQNRGSDLYAFRPDNDSTVPVSQPFELSISIPGDEFPGFETVAFPQGEPLTGFTISDPDQIADDDVFNPAITPTIVWDASNDPETYIHIEFGADIPGVDGGSTGRDSFAIHCSLQDDGEFTFPAQVIGLYPREPYNALLRVVERFKVKEINQPNGTLLLVNFL